MSKRRSKSKRYKRSTSKRYKRRSTSKRYKRRRYKFNLDLGSHKVKLLGSRFLKPNEDGDFTWMIERPEYKNALFIYNDNQKEFLNNSCRKGKGNASIRPYRKGCIPNPKSFGIPTGFFNPVYKPEILRGYTSLNDIDPEYALREEIENYNEDQQMSIRNSSELNAEKIIDASVNEIFELLKTGNYDTLIYSADSVGGLGTGIFKVSEDVKEYIIFKLKEVVNRYNNL